MKSAVLCAVLLTISAGCHAKPSIGGDVPNAAPSESASATPAAPASTTGLNAPGNDPAVVALVNGALACKWGTNTVVAPEDQSCAGWKALNAAQPTVSTTPSTTFVNMLADPDPRVRLFAVRELPLLDQADWRTDPALAKPVVAAASTETASGLDLGLYGTALGRIDYAKTGLWPDAKTILDNGSPGRRRLAPEPVGHPAPGPKPRLLTKGLVIAAVNRAALTSRSRR